MPYFRFFSSSDTLLVLLLVRFLRGKFSEKFWGWRGQTFLGKKKTFLTRKFSRKNFSPKISSGKKSSNTRSGENFPAQNFLETTGNFTRKFLDHLIIELKSVTFPVLDDAYCCTYTRMRSLLYSHMHRVTQTLPQEP